MDREPANIANHRRKMEKGEYTHRDADEFNRWRQNPDKCPPESDVKAAADKLWAEFQAKGGLAACRPMARANVPPAGPQPSQGRPTYNGYRPRESGPAPLTRNDTDNAGGADPRCLGAPFHNPYTFIPFPPPGWFTGVRARRPPTPLSMDEIESERFTGIVEVELATVSPLLTCEPDPVDKDAPHKTYRALTIGDDVIVPATGVRGSLRNLMSIIAGGTLGYLDEGAWLVQGRDRNLGPRGKFSPPETPQHCFLAEVVRPGTEVSPGAIRLGETRLVPLRDLEATAQRLGKRLPRPEANRKPQYLWLDERCESISENRDSRHLWKLKLSGRPINLKGKREGLFKGDDHEIPISSALWAAYLGRNRHGEHQYLRPGDLVWLEPSDPGATEIREEKDIASIQWARWGRRGEALRQAVEKHHRHMLPDSMNPDSKVDEVTDLFGQVPMEGLKAAGPFAARIRPENLVFRDAVKDGLLRNVPLAPLAPPHPGCAAFYRGSTDAGTVANAGPLRGFKVYRTSAENGDKAPWRFSSQGVYGDRGQLQDSHLRVNKTCDLLKEGRTGIVRFACRSLSQRELALLLLACSVDWRLGGGKPLGLGVCRPLRIVARDENGEDVCRCVRDGVDPAVLPAPYTAKVEDLLERRDLWQAAIQPVEMLRYPRALVSNHNRIQRGGHVWFQRHANPRKGGDGSTRGLEVLWVDGDLARAASGATSLRAQPLPPFDPADPQADCLYGYDLFRGEGDEWSRQAGNRQTHHMKLEPFDPTRHVTGNERSGGFQGQNRDNRQAGRSDARGFGNGSPGK